MLLHGVQPIHHRNLQSISINRPSIICTGLQLQKESHMSKDLMAYFLILPPEVLEACCSLPLNLTISGPRGTNGSAS